jgi:tetratricopeptide (TPR) repeat protein
MPDSVKPSRMLIRLEAEIAAAPKQIEADCKRAERAAYLSRLGRFAEARAELGELHGRYDRSPHPAITSWTNLAEGLLSHFTDMGRVAHDKILRSHAISSAANLSRLQALGAAWLAHLDYLQVNVVSMARHLKEAVEISDTREHSTRSRVGLVVAQAYHLAGRMDLALPWYKNSRDHALAEGDEVTMSALMHNMAWLRAQKLRSASLMSSNQEQDSDHALLSANSTGNFDLLIGSASLPALVPILRAQILAARGEYSEALQLFELQLDSAVQDGMGRLHADLLADKAWCRVQLGQIEQGLSDALAAEANIDPTGQFDDRALAHGRLAQVFEKIGDLVRAECHLDLYTHAWNGHVALQSQILHLLADIELSDK